MTLPGDLSTTIITATVLDCSGQPLPGSLTVTPSTDVTDATGAVVIPMAERVYPISGQGTIRTDPLVATDNETLSPQGWVYGLSLQIAGLAPKNWSIELPHSAEPVDISGITPVVPQPDVTSYVALTGGDMTGLLTLDGGLKIPAGAGEDLVLTSDPDGNAEWAPPQGGGGHGGGSGTVTSVSVASANGFAGTVANATSTPALTLETTVTGLLKGNGTGVSAAVSGTDYDAAGAAASAQTAAEAASVPLAGGTMTGALGLTELDLKDSGDLRGGFQSIAGDAWILVNATWDGTDFHRIDKTKAAFGFQIQGQNNIYGEPVPGATMWVAQPESYTLIRGGGSPSGLVYTAVGGWELGFTLTSQRQFTVGGAGIELDGYGTFPFGRVVSGTTGSVLSRHIAGMVRNAFPLLDGNDDSGQESWFWGYVDQFDSVTPSNNNADGYLTGTNHWSVAYLPAGSISSFSGTFDEYLKISPNGATGIVEVSADPTTSLGVATKQYVDGTVAAGAPNAGASTLGLVELNTDLGGTATAPHVVHTNLAAPLPIAQGGTGAGTGSTAPQNDVFAGPGTGGAGSPSFRPLIAADVPTLNQSTTGSAASFTGSLAGDVTGTQGATVVSKIQTVTIQPPLGGATSYLDATGHWSTPAGSGGPPAVQSITTSSTTSYTLAAATYGAFNITLGTGSTPTFIFSGATSGEEISFTVVLTQPSGGGVVVTWPSSGLTWIGGTAPVLNTGTSAVSVFVFESVDGSTWIGSMVTGPQLGSAATSAVAIGTSAGESTVATVTIPANLPAQATYRITAYGTITVGGTGGTTLMHSRLGGLSGTQVQTFTSASLTLSDTYNWRAVAEVTLQAPGSSGTWAGDLTAIQNIQGSAASTYLANPGTATVDSTTAQVFALTLTLSSTTSTASCTGSICERVA